MQSAATETGNFQGRAVFRSIVFLAIAFRLLLVAIVPFGQTVRHGFEGLNDEPAHFNYVKYLALHHSLPVQKGTVKDPGAFVRNDFEYYQPPLYYAIGAVLYSIFGMGTGLYCCRLFSCLCGILTVYCIGAIAYKTVPNPLVKYYALLFAGLSLTHAYFCALVSNDALSWLIATIIVYELVSSDGLHALRGFSPGRGIRLVLLLAAGMLTKSSLAIFFIVVAAWFFIASLSLRKISTAVQGCGIIGFAALLASPWYIRNATLYHSLMALNMGFGPPSHNLTTMRAVLGFMGKTLHYFWFPMQHGISGSTGVRICNVLGGAILVAQTVALAGYMLRNKKPVLNVLLLGLVLILTIISYISLNVSHLEPEGRFLLPAFPAIAFFCAAPVVRLFERRGVGPWAPGVAIATALFPYLYLLFTRAV